jgi:hypothetical protein
MKPDPKADSEQTFTLHFGSLMTRLLKAGVILHWQEPSDPDDEIQIEWNPTYKGMGGEQAFLGLSMLLADICQDGPLSTDEQALIQMLRQTYWEPRND